MRLTTASSLIAMACATAVLMAQPKTWYGRSIEVSGRNCVAPSLNNIPIEMPAACTPVAAAAETVVEVAAETPEMAEAAQAIWEAAADAAVAAEQAVEEAMQTPEYYQYLLDTTPQGGEF